MPTNWTGDPEPDDPDVETGECKDCGQNVPIGPGRRLARHPPHPKSKRECQGIGRYIPPDNPPPVRLVT